VCGNWGVITAITGKDLFSLRWAHRAQVIGQGGYTATLLLLL